MSVLLCKLPPYNTAQSTANTKQGGAAMASEGEKITNVKIINSLSNLQDRLNFYSTWAPTHEQDIAQMEYRSPFYAAETLAGQCPGGAVREGLLVLDVACGTGLVADEMFLFGFRKFHGIDACQQMMDVAQRKGLFQKLILGMLGTGTAPLESGVYDVAVAVGALQGGGVPWTALTEILQSLKPVLMFHSGLARRSAGRWSPRQRLHATLMLTRRQHWLLTDLQRERERQRASPGAHGKLHSRLDYQDQRVRLGSAPEERPSSGGPRTPGPNMFGG
ncbi:methyltransferase-like protein 27 isoform X2 [Amia ocellicauda]|uniref:methyltransferase-like protein 27 isoform X2 n=1 Tax=Amia ocellicauda TaxID=2972642 RepID=UPI003464BB16